MAFENAFSAVPRAQTVAPRPAQTNPALAFAPTAALPATMTSTANPIAASRPQPIPVGSPQAAFPGLPQAPPPAPTTTPGNNMVNPGLSEQAFNSTQNRLNEDPFQSTFQNVAGAAGQPSQGESYLNQNLGTLNGPGQGDQYWNQVQGQFQNPMAGEQFARQATQNFSPTGAAGAFNTQAQGQYDQFTGFTGAGQSQGQYNQNAASGPLAGQSFYDSVAGQAGTTGRYSDPNLSAGQYAQTQQSFGDLPVPTSADPFYDRSIQLGTQAYNQGAAGRGVYGSSEALNGVGNIITDLNAKRAQTAFGNSMSIAQEQRARQELLGNQARMGDLSSLSGFQANLAGLETFGNLAGQAGNQTLGQQTMLGNQARDADQSAQAAQNSNIQGLGTLGNIAGQADTAETNRYSASTNAMNQADRTGIDRLNSGADIAFRGDDNARQNFTAQANAATNAGQLQNNRQNTQIAAGQAGSSADLNRLNSLNNAAQGAEGQRQNRLQSQIDQIFKRDSKIADLIGKATDGMSAQSQADFENYITSTLAPIMNDASLSESEKQARIAAAVAGFKALSS